MDMNEIGRIGLSLKAASDAFKSLREASIRASIHTVSLSLWRAKFRISVRRRGKRHVFFINLFD